MRHSLMIQPGEPHNGDMCQGQAGEYSPLDWGHPDVAAALKALTAALKQAGLNENTVHQLLQCQHARPDSFPYPAPAAWNNGDENLADRFLLLQLLIEMWVQQKQPAAPGTSGTFFRDPQAPRRDGMSMRVTPEL